MANKPKAPKKKYQILKSFCQEGGNGPVVVQNKIRTENPEQPIYFEQNITTLPKAAVELGEKLGCIREIL